VISIKSAEEIGKIHRAARIVREAFLELKGIIAPGVTTKKLNDVSHRFITSQDAKPAFLGYRGFPASICTSVNCEVVHGIPGKRRLRDGEIISIDLGVLLDGYYADAAATFPVGCIREDLKRLLEVTKRCLREATMLVRPGNRISDISHRIQEIAEGAGFSVVRDFVGHGIGRMMHELPQIPNFGPSGQGIRMKPGMVLCLEPMVNMGDWRVEVLEDGWTVVTIDRKASCHFEDTILVTHDGCEVLTRILDEELN
jgi:methionyl aminopeptidase